MSFSSNLQAIRKQRGITQEQLAEMLNVSRQAVSKWESGNGFPETEKLLIISKKLDVSLDYLLNDQSNTAESEKDEFNPAVHFSTGKIAITAFDGEKVVFCQAVKADKILAPGKNEPKYVLSGIDKVTFLGEHSTILGWYETKEDVKQEIQSITAAINNGEPAYSLKYAANIELKGIFGQPKIKE